MSSAFYLFVGLTAKKQLTKNTLFAICTFFVVGFLKVDGKEPLCRQLADGKEVADGKMPDSSSDTHHEKFLEGILRGSNGTPSGYQR